MSFGAAYLETLMYRIKFLFSVETLCFALLWWGGYRLFDRIGIIPNFNLQWTNPELYRQYQAVHIIVVIFLFLLIYGTGEFIRRKYKFESLLFFDTKDSEKRQQLLQLMKDRPNINIEMISYNLEITQFHVMAYIRALKKIQVIEQRGTRKNPHWVVKS